MLSRHVDSAASHHADAVGDRPRQKIVIGEGGELDEASAVGKRRPARRRRGQRQSGLSDTTDTSERHQALTTR